MQQRDRPGEGDIRGPTKGDYSFTDWDNPEDDLPEDEIEDAPEGYYDEDEEDEEDEIGPENPDYDLSEGAGYSGWDRERRTGIPQWVVVAISLVLILSLLLPVLLRSR
ncbi:MAG: hypothetical protein Q8Q00_11615 [Dehalococcoidia bacterium]|nr:hypothetical protein [Dehalococcoidia bacterium]